MGLGQLSLFSALTDKMKWHQTRQSLLSENIANAETPGFRGHDLKPFSVEDMGQNLGLMVPTGGNPNVSHISFEDFMGTDGFTTRRMNNFEVTPEGNGVTLEDEMMKVTSNQMDYQAVTTLYSRSMRIIKTALGRSA